MSKQLLNKIMIVLLKSPVSDVNDLFDAPHISIIDSDDKMGRAFIAIFVDGFAGHREKFIPQSVVVPFRLKFRRFPDFVIHFRSPFWFWVCCSVLLIADYIMMVKMSRIILKNVCNKYQEVTA